MILGKPFRDPAAPESPFHATTLDDLFRRAAERRGDAIALVDPPDRRAFTDGAPRRLTYGEADRVITALAARLTQLGLNTDAVVALQLPNTVESALVILAVLRAGMIAVPLPLLWRQSEAVRALGRIGARALITCRRIGPADHGEIAMHVAAETFTIRFLCTFGDEPLDGFASLDDVFGAEAAAKSLPIERTGNPADHVALVTFDVTADGLVPVARSHAELIAGGLAVVMGARIGRDSCLLTALTTCSFAGLCTSVVPWLICGGTLSLHQPFEGASFAAQFHDGCDVAVLPGPLIARLSEAGLLEGRDKTFISVWRAPERAAASPAWTSRDNCLVDVLTFGEIGLVANPRAAEGKLAPVKAGKIAMKRGDGDGLILLEIARSEAGTVALGGAMVPRHPFPPGIERNGAARLKVSDDGVVDTAYPCAVDRASGVVTVNGPPAGIVSIGGYRFVLRELQEFIAGVAEGSTLAALPDGLSGHRLAGVATDREAVRRALVEQGVNPLVVEAFRERRGDRASAA